jgi:hypothetical protein
MAEIKTLRRLTGYARLHTKKSTDVGPRDKISIVIIMKGAYGKWHADRIDNDK